MKGYRTPSWFRMKGIAKKKQAKAGMNRRRASKNKRVAGR